MSSYHLVWCVFSLFSSCMALLTMFQIAGLGLSFHCARTLRGKVELLPSGPPWKSTVVSLPGYATKDPLVLYYRDPMNCIEFTMKNPLFSGKIQYQPRQDFDSYGNRTYGDWITSDGAWDYQVRIFMYFIASLPHLDGSRAAFHHMLLSSVSPYHRTRPGSAP